MKRCVVTLLVFLLLGAIVNVAVAWGLSLRSVQRGKGQELPADQDTIEWWRVHAPPGFADAPAGMYESRRFGCCMLMLYDKHPQAGVPNLALRLGNGWPMTSMELSVWKNGKTGTKEVRNAIKLRGRPFAIPFARTIPVQPVWLGFAANTCVYGASLLLLYAGTVSVRRWLRIKRGQCPECAYPIGISPVCTECGRPIKARSGGPSA